MISARPATPDDTYDTVWKQLMSIQKNWNTDREKAKAELKALLWNIEGTCAKFASTAWTYFVEGVKSLLSGAKQGIEDLIEYVITHQDELKAAPAKALSFVGSLWDATDRFCKDLRNHSLYEEDEDLSAKPKMN